MSIHPQTGHTHSANALMTHSTHAFWEKVFFLRLTCRHLAFIILWQCWKKTVVFHTKTPTTHPPLFPLYHFTLCSYGSLRSSLLMLIVNSKVKKQLALKEDTIGIGREGEAMSEGRQIWCHGYDFLCFHYQKPAAYTLLTTHNIPFLQNLSAQKFDCDLCKVGVSHFCIKMSPPVYFLSCQFYLHTLKEGRNN